MTPSPFPAWVGYACVDTPEPLFPEEAALLSPNAVPSRQRDFALGRTAARRALGRAVPIGRGPHRAPCWPPGVVGAITHAAGLAAAATAPTTRAVGVGLDLEDLARLEDLAIARHVADEDEQRWIGEDPRRLALLFSAKEAAYKALYPLRRGWIGFDAVSLRWRADGFDAELREPMGSSHPQGHPFRVDVQVIGDVCLTSTLLPL